MANKNTKQIREELKRARKRGESFITVSKPVGNYHSMEKGGFTTYTIPTRPPRKAASK